MIFPAPLLVEINSPMWVLLKGVENIIVAGLTDLGANVGFGCSGYSGWKRFCVRPLALCG